MASVSELLQKWATSGEYLTAEEAAKKGVEEGLAAKKFTEKSPTASFFERQEEQRLPKTLGEVIPRGTGAVVGGIAGMPFGVVPSAITGGIGAGVEATLRGADPSEIQSESLIGAGTQLGAGILTKIPTAARAVKELPVKLFGKYVKPGATEVQQYLSRRVGGRPGTFLLPSQATENRIAIISANIARVGWTGAQKMAKFSKDQIVKLRGLGKHLADSFGQTRSPEEIGSLIVDTIDGNATAFHTAGRAAFKTQIDEIEKSAQTEIIKRSVKTGFIKPSGGEFTREVSETVLVPPVSYALPKAKAKELLHKIKESVDPSGDGKRYLQEIIDAPDNIWFEQAQVARSRLLQLHRTREGTLAYDYIAPQLASSLDEAMEAAAKNLSPEALRGWRAANGFWRWGKETFENDFLVGLAQKDPRSVAQVLWKSKRADDVVMIEKALNRTNIGKGVMDKVRAGFVENILEQSKNPVTKTFMPERLSKNLDLDDFNERVFYNTLFSKQQLTGLRSLQNAAEFVSSKSDKAGEMMIQLMQPGAVMAVVGTATGLVTGSPTAGIGAGLATQAAVVVAPHILAKMLLNPVTAEKVAMGMTMTASNPEWPKLLRFLTSAAVRIGGQGAVQMIGGKKE